MMILHIVSIPANNLSRPGGFVANTRNGNFDWLEFRIPSVEFDSAYRDLVTTLGMFARKKMEEWLEV
jgi:hypothetical protein